jgi:uncharacterized membrane protein
LAAEIMEGAGVAVIVIGALISGLLVGVAPRALGWDARYRSLRRRLGRAILLGLELLVGADIIRTVSEVPTLGRVAVLAGIVLIRTFLSFTIEAELEGRWPWQWSRARTSSRQVPDEPPYPAPRPTA